MQVFLNRLALMPFLDLAVTVATSLISGITAYFAMATDSHLGAFLFLLFGGTGSILSGLAVGEWAHLRQRRLRK